MPDWKPEIRQRLAGLGLSPTREVAIVEELAQHLDDCYAELLAGGATEDEAYRAALAELSGSELLTRELRRVERQVAPEPIVLGTTRRRNMIADLWQDLRYGARMLLKQPGFTAVVVLTLSLGIGATATVFSVVDGVLLQALPYRDAAGIVTFSEVDRRNGQSSPVSLGNFLDLQRRNQVFAEVAAARPWRFEITGQGEPEELSAWLVSDGFFRVLGVNALRGRLFTPEEYRAGNNQVVVLSYGFWQRRFGARPEVIGEKLSFGNVPFTVVGVLPPEVEFPEKRELWSPFVIPNNAAQARGRGYLPTVGRLKPNTSMAQAQAAVEAIAKQLAVEYPRTNTNTELKAMPLREQLVGHVRPALLVLFGAVGFVLLIACANVANLLLVRGAARQKELAVRLALGATRRRLVRQLLTENLLLAALGTVIGVLLANWGVHFILRLKEGLPRAGEVGMNWRVLLFAVLVSGLTALLFGLIPSLQFSAPDLQNVLKEGSQTTTPAGWLRRLRSGLTVAELALALTLLVGAGLLARSFVSLLRVDPGFRSDNVATLQVHIHRNYPKPEQQAAFFERALEKISLLPGVQAACAASAPPLIKDSIDVEAKFGIEGRPQPATGEEPTAFHTVVTAGYFETLKIPLRQGRLFNQTDNAGAAPVAVINDSLARRYWPHENPIGKRIAVQWNQPAVREIVGVVADIRHTGFDSAPRPELFLPHLQQPFGSMAFVVRTVDDTAALLPALKQAIWSVNKDQVIRHSVTLEELISQTLEDRQFNLLLLGLFATIALVLALVGVYGLISSSTGQRLQEIGIRLALGAQREDILKMLMREGAGLIFCGVGLGLVGAFTLTRFLRKLLFGIEPTDPLIFLGISLLLVAVALLACYIPARRATKVDPVNALRYE
jgi:putative ABC transport system permease protein